MDDIYNRIGKIVEKKIKNKNITPASTLEELGLDSLDKAEIMINLEDEFHIEFEEEEMALVKKVKDLHDLIEKKTVK